MELSVKRIDGQMKYSAKSVKFITLNDTYGISRHDDTDEIQENRQMVAKLSSVDQRQKVENNVSNCNNTAK